MNRFVLRASLVALLSLLATPALAQDFSGTWDVSGSDPALGPYVGEAQVALTPGGYSFVKLVEFAQKLPDGRTLAVSWEGTGKNDPQGLRVEVSLRRQEWVSRAGTLRRGPQDKAPLVLGATLKAPGGPIAAVPPATRIEGRFDPGGPTEAWVKVTRAPASLPRLAVSKSLWPKTAPLLKSTLFTLYKAVGWFNTPGIAPYVNRPEFQAAEHAFIVDRTGREWLRAHPDRLLVPQKVVDAISLVEEGQRAAAFRWKLHEKAARYDAEMLTDHVEKSTGMIGGKVIATGLREVHGDSGLHQGSWVASQGWRYLATNDPVALANVEAGTRAILTMIDAPGNPAEFARAVQEAATAPANWNRSPVLPGLAYLTKGNNDMLHGVDYGLVMAEHVLPAGHPLLPEVGKRAKSLVENCGVAQKGMHQLVLAGLASRLTGDASVTSLYKKKLAWNPLELLWLMDGEGIQRFLELTEGNSGRHLGTVSYAKMLLLGAKSPNTLEKLWRSAATTGVKRAFGGYAFARPGLLANVAGGAGAPGARDLALDVLAEVPCPRPSGDWEADFTIDPAWCPSPYPAFFYKADFMKNPDGRRQSLTTPPLFQYPSSDNYWKQGPGDMIHSGADGVRWPSMDYLHAYWYGRAHGLIGPTD